jgi:Ca2+-binding EF-hand superfamily protein
MGLRNELATASGSHAGSKKLISRKEFETALGSLSIEDSDCEVFDRLFTLFDKTGAGKVHYLEISIGLSVIVNGTVSDRLILGMELADELGKGYVTKEEMLFVFKAMNNTVNFLGDPVMELSQVEEMVESLFVAQQESSDELTEAFDYSANCQSIWEHPIFESWLRAKDAEMEGENSNN